MPDVYTDIMASPFHLAFPVADLDSTRVFYLDVLGCTAGRSGPDWIDIDFFGSQIVAHVSEAGSLPTLDSNVIDGHEVPLPHFGAVLSMEAWRVMASKLREADVDFVIEPHVRYEGMFKEQASLLLRDPSGNALEFKAFADPSRLFATD
ncbi:MAG: glyoxalase [Planctomycetota bacterium]|nr:glyoxalase [Planctomycetota bacterium]